MIIFLDTSSLFKLYHQENETDSLLKFIDNHKITRVFLSEIAKVEFTSSVWKKVRTKEIEVHEAEQTLLLFQNDLIKYKFITTNTIILEQAEILITKYGEEGLRTLDSIQLASCISLKEKINLFITSDKLLKKLMIKEGLETDF